MERSLAGGLGRNVFDIYFVFFKLLCQRLRKLSFPMFVLFPHEIII